MVEKPHPLDAKLEHIRLQKHVYDLVRVQNLSVKDVIQKTGLSQVTIYRYLRTFPLKRFMRMIGKDTLKESL